MAGSELRIGELEEALRKSEEKYNKVFRLSPDAININRLDDGAFIDINEGFTAITGYTFEDVGGRSSMPGDLGVWVEADDRARLVALLRQHGEASDLEARFRRKDGSIIIGVMSARIIELDGVACVLSVTRDITDRKRAEAELACSEERFRSLIELAVDAILLGDPAGNIIGANQRAAELTGHPVTELHRLGISDLFSATELQRQPLRYDLLREGLVVSNERLLSRKDGGTVPIEMISKMMPDGTYQSFIRDISERRRIEADRAVAESRMRESQKLEALGQLAGGIAHDFNNQLAGIIGNAELLTRRLQEAGLRHYAERIIIQAERSAALTRQLLAFARKGRHLSVGVDLHQLIAEVVELLSHSIDKRISVSQRLEARISTTLGDPDLLQNALLNLALNARDAMPNGGGLEFATTVVELAADAPDPDLPAGGYLCITVTDTGTGMDTETQRHLFEPFFTTKEAGKGTGLGLASVYGAVKDHHGSIRISSQPDHGTRVAIHLPLHHEAKAATPPSPAVPAAGSGRILLVDDDEDIRHMTTEMLRSLGYAVNPCCDGAAAVKAYRQEWRSIDLVVLDLVMPRMGGREAFLAMRRINPRLKALIASGFGVDGQAQELLDLGAIGFVNKPFRFADLGERVAHALRRQV